MAKSRFSIGDYVREKGTDKIGVVIHIMRQGRQKPICERAEQS
jgi:hypothetical protein